MARVRDHAAEYAALKARAQAAGLSTRAYRRARAENPLKYGAPITQRKIRQRLLKFEPVSTANTTDRNIRANLIKALANRGATGDLADIADRRIAHHPHATLASFNRTYKQWERDASSGDRFYLTADEYDEIGSILYYRD